MKASLQSALQSATIAAALVTTTAPVAESFAPPAISSSLPSSSAAAAAFSSLRSALMDNIPSVEELSSDPFMKQVGYGSELAVALRGMEGLTEAEQASLGASLEAQLSHSDGIRGFMVAYLTGTITSSSSDDDESGEGESNINKIADETDPKILLETLHGLLTTTTTTTTTTTEASGSSSSSNDLVSLMCMNVVMPVAMITMHQDPALSEASRMTAARGGRLLASVFGSSPAIRSNASAILAAAEGGADGASDADPELVEYWKDFFGKWGYQDAQTKDIAATMTELLSSSQS